MWPIPFWWYLFPCSCFQFLFLPFSSLNCTIILVSEVLDDLIRLCYFCWLLLVVACFLMFFIISWCDLVFGWTVFVGILRALDWGYAFLGQLVFAFTCHHIHYKRGGTSLNFSACVFLRYTSSAESSLKLKVLGETFYMASFSTGWKNSHRDSLCFFLFFFKGVFLFFFLIN